MANIKLDLARMKHISSDQHSTMLQHPDGHTITLAHAALSPDSRSQLDTLAKMANGGKVAEKVLDEKNPKLAESHKKPPKSEAFAAEKVPNENHQQVLKEYREKSHKQGQEQYKDIPYQKRKMYADQDTVVSKDDTAPTPQSNEVAPGVHININPAPQQPTGTNTVLAPPQPAAPSSQSAAPAGIAPKGLNPASTGPVQSESPNQALAQTVDEAPAAPDSTDQPQTAQPDAQTTPEPLSLPQQAYDNTSRDLHQEDAAWRHDLNNGHIAPETLQSLYANKSTLGKIGTIFGLMLGGTGGALTGRGNALLDIMQKQIDNDLQAQMKSKDNAQNFLRITQQQEMNKANISSMNAETAIKVYTLAQARMLQSSFHELRTMTSSMPEGPQKEQAKQILGIIYSNVGDKITNLIDRAAGAAQYGAMTYGPPNSTATGEAAFQQQQRGMNMLGPEGQRMAGFHSDRHIPGIPGEASRPIPEKIRDQVQAMNTLDLKGRDVLNFIKQHSGTWNPQTQATAEQKIDEMKNFYNQSIEGGALTEGRLAWYDKQFKQSPTDIIAQLRGSTKKLEEVVKSNATRRDNILSGPAGLGFPKTKVINGVTYQVSPDGKTATKVK